MSKISESTMERVRKQILSALSGDRQLFTYNIAGKVGRGNSFVKRILMGLKKKGLISSTKIGRMTAWKKEQSSRLKG